MNNSTIDALKQQQYISLATRKRSGDFVPTPVWFAPFEGSYYVFSAKNAGKVKRIRNFAECQLAACTVTGKLKGEWMDAQAYILHDSDDVATALAALHKKYGLKMIITDLASKISGKYNHRCYLKIDPSQ